MCVVKRGGLCKMLGHGEMEHPIRKIWNKYVTHSRGDLKGK